MLYRPSATKYALLGTRNTRQVPKSWARFGQHLSLSCSRNIMIIFVHYLMLEVRSPWIIYALTFWQFEFSQTWINNLDSHLGNWKNIRVGFFIRKPKFFSIFITVFNIWRIFFTKAYILYFIFFRYLEDICMYVLAVIQLEYVLREIFNHKFRKKIATEWLNKDASLYFLITNVDIYFYALIVFEKVLLVEVLTGKTALLVNINIHFHFLNIFRNQQKCGPVSWNFVE